MEPPEASALGTFEVRLSVGGSTKTLCHRDGRTRGRWRRNGIHCQSSAGWSGLLERRGLV